MSLTAIFRILVRLIICRLSAICSAKAMTRNFTVAPKGHWFESLDWSAFFGSYNYYDPKCDPMAMEFQQTVKYNYSNLTTDDVGLKFPEQHDYPGYISTRYSLASSSPCYELGADLMNLPHIDSRGLCYDFAYKIIF